MENYRSAIERLYQDETLTADVDDATAKVLLRWGEERIRAGRPEEEVRQAIRALNRVIARRATLAPAEAYARLRAAVLSGLWAEAPAEEEWARRLVGTSAVQEGRRAGQGKWWQRLFFWRKRP
jgi:hypothetical protein